MNKQRKILLLGSGMMAEAVVDYLLLRQENHITIASNIIDHAQYLAKKHNGRVQANYADAMKIESIIPLVKASEIVVSYLPATMHVAIAKVCLQEKKNLVTASYISPQMRELDGEAKKLGLTFLNEIGLDPGIDHLATMKVVDECKETGDKIIEYESWCGGLPSPDNVDNPLGYKFSWSPIGAFGALRNDAKFLDNNQIVTIPGTDLLYKSERKDISMALNLEGYPNRDSIQYKELYNLKDAHKVLRGTLRFEGFTIIMNAFKELGLFREDLVEHAISWPEYLFNTAKENCPKKALALVSSFESDRQRAVKIAQVISKCLNNKNYNNLRPDEIESRAQKILEAFYFFGAFDEKKVFKPKQSYLQNLVYLVEDKLALKEGQTDLVVMQHMFKILKKNNKVITRKSTLIMIGEKKGKSAMALTVGTPTAVAVQLILDGVIKDVGVLMPNKKSIYEPITKKLAEVGISCIETEEAGSLKPKL